MSSEQEPGTGLSNLRRAAEAGDPDAMYWLGTELGHHDVEAARNWLEKSAELGSTDAMNALGHLLRDTDPSDAEDWAEAAAVQGDTRRRSTSA